MGVSPDAILQLIPPIHLSQDFIDGIAKQFRDEFFKDSMLDYFQKKGIVPLPPQASSNGVLTYQKKNTTDFTVGVKYGVARNGLGYLLHVARARVTPHEVESLVIDEEL
jgi:hypothetical protein